MTVDQPSENLAAAIRSLEPRHAQLLVWRYVNGSALERCAEQLGISTDAVRIHLIRALDALDASLASRRPTLRPDDEERQLARALEGFAATTDAARLKTLGDRLQAHAKQIDAALREAALAEELSPDRVREDWIRRIAVLILVGLAAFFYWRNESREGAPPSPPARQQR